MNSLLVRNADSHLSLSQIVIFLIVECLVFMLMADYLPEFAECWSGYGSFSSLDYFYFKTGSLIHFVVQATLEL